LVDDRVPAHGTRGEVDDDCFGSVHCI
jgi:hypothetical protein